MPHADPQPLSSEARRWLLLAKFAGLGLLLLIGGFVYGMTTSGLPYQDPTPEMQVRWEYHNRIAMMVMLSGLAITALTLIALTLNAAGSMLHWVWSLKNSRSHPD